jgi:hypothetical protein
MLKSYIFCVIISIIINFVLAASDDSCESKSNTNCTTCLNIKGCAYCKTSKECFAHSTIPIDGPCQASDLQIGTCFG